MAVSAATRYHDRLKKKRQAIKIKQGQLGLDEATYRLLLKRVAGVTSSRDLLTQDAADAVLAELHRLGAPVSSPRPRVKNEWAFVFVLTGERKKLGQKIYRCAEKIGAAQTPPVKVMPKAWVEGIARQAAGLNVPEAAGKVVKPLETCAADELMTIIKILESWAKKIHA